MKFFFEVCSHPSFLPSSCFQMILVLLILPKVRGEQAVETGKVANADPTPKTPKDGVRHEYCIDDCSAVPLNNPSLRDINFKLLFNVCQVSK